MRDLAQVEYAEWAASQGASLVAIEFLTGSLIEQGWNQNQVDRLFDKSPGNSNTREPECPIQIPEGLRWYEPTVMLYVSTKISKEDQAWLADEIAQLKGFVESVSSLKIDQSFSQRLAHVKNIDISELDGPGGTLGETRFGYSGDRMRSAEIVCDSADQRSPILKSSTKKHELLHALGVPHHNDPRALMYFALNSAKTYDDFAAAELVKRHPIAKPA